MKNTEKKRIELPKFIHSHNAIIIQKIELINLAITDHVARANHLSLEHCYNPGGRKRPEDNMDTKDNPLDEKMETTTVN